jgi:NTP pyrophosphatase (non-canonical NTP hydrolase)
MDTPRPEPEWLLITGTTKEEVGELVEAISSGSADN